MAEDLQPHERTNFQAFVFRDINATGIANTAAISAGRWYPARADPSAPGFTSDGKVTLILMTHIAEDDPCPKSSEPLIDRRRRPPLCLVVAAVAVVALASCGGESGNTKDTVTASPSTEIIDIGAGSYRGVSIGSSRDALFAQLGHGQSQGPATTLSNPMGNDGAPWHIRVPDGVARSRYRYRHVVAFLGERRIHTLLIDDPSAATAEGVAIGDPIDRVAEVYRNAVCGVVNENSEYEPYPACYLERTAGPYVWFGPDPIRSITLSANRLDDLSPK